MAPDINSMPPSPYRPSNTSSSGSLRITADQRMNASPSSPPSHPHMSTFPLRDASSPTGSGPNPIPDNTGVGAGPGPLRHPRPLTAADLHMQLEKEQEAVVNRLTRELSLLRQQTVSVASTTSSTSNSMLESTEQTGSTMITGSNNPTSSLRHRSSSSLSSRNASTAPQGPTNNPAGTNSLPSTTGIAGSSSSGIAPPRDTAAPYTNPRDPLSRQSSIASRRSEASSPSLSSSFIQGDNFPGLHARRLSGSGPQALHASLMQSNQALSANRSSHISSTARSDENAHARSELEILKKENDELKRRVRELERALRHRQSEPDHSRSASMNTNASFSLSISQDPSLQRDDEQDGS